MLKMFRKPPLNNEVLSKITTLSRSVGEFGKMQIYDMDGAEPSIFTFQAREWRTDIPCLKTDLEPYAKHYTAVHDDISRMNQITEKQDEYRKENKIQSVEDFLEEERLKTQKRAWCDSGKCLG